MNWKNRLTNYNFWISIVSAVLLIFQAFKFEFDIAYINEIVTAVLGLLVVIGIISDPTRTSVKTQNQTKSGENSKTEETSVPSANENEDDYVNSKIDYEAIVKQISKDLSEQMQNLSAVAKFTSPIEKTELVEQTNTQLETVENVELSSGTNEQTEVLDELPENNITYFENDKNLCEIEENANIEETIIQEENQQSNDEENLQEHQISTEEIIDENIEQTSIFDECTEVKESENANEIEDVKETEASQQAEITSNETNIQPHFGIVN